MRTALRTLALITAVSTFAQTPAPPKPAPGFTWPVPTGWNSEVIPFPLDFAPSLPHRGLEAIRFAPGFFKPDQTDWWSYIFVWWLEDKALPDRTTLEAELTTYYKGLCQGVGAKKYTFDPAHYSVHLKPEPSRQGGATAYTGTIEAYDPFRTGKPITLHARIKATQAADHRVVLFSVSPQPEGAPIWSELGKVADGFVAP